MLKVKYSATYHQDYKELLQREPELAEEIDRRLRWFRKNPGDTRLDNHGLTKNMAGQWAFSITGDIRVIYEWKGKNRVRFLAIGGHQKEYGK